MSIIRWVAFGDTHGVHRDENALDVMERFIRSYDPHVIIAAGDLFDLAALRARATEEDKNADILSDVELGIDVIKRFRPNVYLFGNHEFRLECRRRSGSASMRAACERTLADIHDACRRTKTVVIPYSRKSGIYRLGNLAFLHGYAQGEYAAAKHARIYGDCVHYHIHAFSVATVPRIDGNKNLATAWSAPRMCVDMEYMEPLSGTLRQESGWMYGTVNEKNGKFFVECCRETEDYAW